MNVNNSHISKAQVKWVRSLQQKKHRDAEGVFVAEGTKCVEELRSAFDLVLLVSTENATNTVVTLSGLTNALTSIANTNFPDSSSAFDNQNVVISYENLSNDILGISKIDVSDKTDASSAVETLDKAINKITLEQEKFEGYEKEFSDILENDGYMDEIVNWI